MKKIFIVLAFFIGVYMISCKPDTRPHAITQEKLLTVIGFNEVHIVVVDSCEYLVTGSGPKFNQCHKGNCKFCAERRHKELVALFNEIRITNQKH